MMNSYLYDFRKCIIERKHCKEYWKCWDNWNILYKTLAFEISGSRDVESYVYVRNMVFQYFANYEQYVGNEISLDIMNGWWFCFKTLFKIDTGRKSKETKQIICEIMKKIANIDIYHRKDLVDALSKEYNLDVKVVEMFLDYLELVYTIGNIAPVPKGGNVHADKFDSWEYKMFISNALKYEKTEYKEYFFFDEYKEDSKWWNELKSTDDKIQIVFKYMSSRVQLIKNRGEKIVKE